MRGPERVINARVPASCKYQIADTASCGRQRRLTMNRWRKSASITEACLTRDVSRLAGSTAMLSEPQAYTTNSAPEANVEFHDIVAAVGESQMNAMIPDVMQLLTFYSVYPASTATSAERSFSHLRRIKSYIRNTMWQQRLVSLMLLSAYPEMVDNLNIPCWKNTIVLPWY